MTVSRTRQLRARAWYLTLVAVLLLASSLACTPLGIAEPRVSTDAPAAVQSPTSGPVSELLTPTPSSTAQPTIEVFPTATTTATVVSPTPPAAATLPANFSTQAAMEHARQLAEVIGIRASATTGMERAAEYIAAQLRSYGYYVALQPFPLVVFENRETVLSIRTPEPRTIQTSPLHYSRSGEVSGPIVHVGLGRKEDFAGKDVRGKVVLAERGVLLLSEKASNAAAAGAAAVVIYNNRPGLFYGALREPGRILTVSISDRDGKDLLTLLARGPVTVHVKVDAVTEQRQGINVVARGPEPAERQILLGAHYDSVPTGPGANDNASGVAVVLELARVLAAWGEANRITVVAFAGEEQGLIGSKAYVDGLDQAAISRLAAMLNLDMVGAGRELEVAFGGEARAEAYAQSVKTAGEEGGLHVRATRAGADSDHGPFAEKGVPVLFVTTGIDPYYHTPQDTVDKLEPDTMRKSGELLLHAVEQILRQLR